MRSVTKATVLALFLCAAASGPVLAQDAPVISDAVDIVEAEIVAHVPVEVAQEAPEITSDSSAAARVLNHVLEALASLLLLVLTWAALKAKTWFSEKTKIEIPAAIDARIMSVAEKAVGFAESKGRQFLANTSAKMAGPDKLETALDFGLDLAEAQGLPEWGKEKLESYIEAKLGLDRLSADG